MSKRWILFVGLISWTMHSICMEKLLFTTRPRLTEKNSASLKQLYEHAYHDVDRSYEQGFETVVQRSKAWQVPLEVAVAPHLPLKAITWLEEKYTTKNSLATLFSYINLMPLDIQRTIFAYHFSDTASVRQVVVGSYRYYQSFVPRTTVMWPEPPYVVYKHLLVYYKKKALWECNVKDGKNKHCLYRMNQNHMSSSRPYRLLVDRAGFLYAHLYNDTLLCFADNLNGDNIMGFSNDKVYVLARAYQARMFNGRIYCLNNHGIIQVHCDKRSKVMKIIGGEGRKFIPTHTHVLIAADDSPFFPLWYVVARAYPSRGRVHCRIYDTHDHTHCATINYRSLHSKTAPRVAAYANTLFISGGRDTQNISISAYDIAVNAYSSTHIKKRRTFLPYATLSDYYGYAAYISDMKVYQKVLFVLLCHVYDAKRIMALWRADTLEHMGTIPIDSTCSNFHLQDTQIILTSSDGSLLGRLRCDKYNLSLYENFDEYVWWK